ncbi:cobalamin biosynthesis protein [Leptolyngbya sp. Heron Island J]|uniref:sirohydrochlorin chelatase n=1 Tax=Leptolyngbya sp. Heron Island J TaxID=1385935 RepID=UPI0003B979FB|nr:CbiX/SirB N-terminal domain-containing protein [Leptolyngbya sp. Heron Island J]ESA37190.1 cobalamin biosynthesis protein [Leptolyngbya sp. Heron Island J]
MTSTAYLLISHGSRDPRHQVAINRLAQLIREQLNPALVSPWSSQPFGPLMPEGRALGAPATVLDFQDRPRKSGMSSVMTAVSTITSTTVASAARLPQDRLIVGTAVLEFGLLPLHQQICEFGRRLSSAGIERLHLVPLFLLRGKHVMQDIPDEVEQARQELGGTIELELGAHIGGSQSMLDLIANRFLHSPRAGRLLVAHGSRRARGNRVVDNLAKSLGTAVAYWTNESEIENQTIQLMQQGCSTLTIFPYFLFAGGITDAVAHLTEELAERFPRTSFRLLPPLGATYDIANLVVETLRP